jgi:hypothetical protein
MDVVVGDVGMLADASDVDLGCRGWRRLYHGRTETVPRSANC